jgi:RNA ligase
VIAVPSLDTLAAYVERRLVSRVDMGSLAIFNYTERATYECAWDDVTQAARGLVLNVETGEVVARAFDKFFNLGERGIVQTLPDAPPDVVTVKHDGSLGIGFRHEGRMRWTTRGSFYSPQAAIGQAIWDRDHAGVRIPDELTPLVEIIAPGTRNVVNYGDRECLALLGIRNRHTGRDLSYETVEGWADAWGLPVTERVTGGLPEIVDRAARMSHQEEGFVVRWGDFRVKVKSTEYMRVARLIAGLTDRAIADLWYAERRDLLVPLPEEHRGFAETRMAEFDGEATMLGDELDALWERVGGIADRRALVNTVGREHALFGAVMNRFSGRAPDLRLLVYRRRFDAKPREVGAALTDASR